MNAIVGYTGFVGSNLLQFYNFDYLYNSKNFYEAKNKEFNNIFFCGIPAVKWYANKNPIEDNNIIENIKKILDTVKVKKIILISTIDVYDKIDKQYNEDYEIHYDKNHIYGKNRFLFEEYIKSTFINYNIIRLPGLFGKGLKKNIIYDLINNNKVNNIPLNSSFQWYYLDWLKKDIDIILKNDIKICNLFTEPIHTKEIIKAFNEIYNIDYLFQLEYLGDEKLLLEYNTCTKYNNYFDCNKKYIIEADKIIKAIKEYLIFEKINKSKLCVSNICVNKVSQLQFASILKLYGIRNVQIAPTKLIESWDKIETLDLSIYKNLGLNVYSFQSITYTLNNLNIFDKTTREDLYKHLIKIIDCAEKNSIKVIVFGCPINRQVIDKNLNNEETFIKFFKKIGNYLKNKNVKICIENNSKKYKCNFINTIEECSNIVRKINNKNIKMMIDLGNAVMENDNWYYLKQYMDIIYNIDVAHPYMRDYSEIHESNEIFNFVIKNNNYDKMVNLEMLIKDENNELELLCKSLTNFIYLYS
jgi:sugar phosphate isomerase/epimerase